MLPALLPQDPPPGELGAGCALVAVLLVLVGAALFALIKGKLRPKHLPPLKSPEQAKEELEQVLQAGIRDVRGEAHVRAFLSWSRLWALLEFVGFVLYLTGPTAGAGEAATRRDLMGWTLAMTAVAGVLWVGLWVTGNAVRGGSDGARVLYGFLATTLALALAFTLAFDPRPWASDPRSRFVHTFMVVYTIAGASFLFHPRCARLSSAAYREETARSGTEVSKEAQAQALFRSPFSWVPIVCFLSSLLVQFALEKALGK